MSDELDLKSCSAASLRNSVAKFGLPRGRRLTAALKNPDRGVLACLLENGLDLNYSGSNPVIYHYGQNLQRPFWFWIIQNENPLVLADAIAAGANVSSTDLNGQTGLHLAADTSVAHCEILLAAGIDISARNAIGYQAIHHAVRKNNNPVVPFLLARGADANSRSKNGLTPLHVLLKYCGSYDFTATIDILARAGANVNALDDTNCSVLHHAVSRCSFTMQRS